MKLLMRIARADGMLDVMVEIVKFEIAVILIPIINV